MKYNIAATNTNPYQFIIDKLVLQPTTLCNLNCSYCYLPSRKSSSRMSIDVCKRVVEFLNSAHSTNVSLIWHGGEPLTVGHPYFRQLLEEFESLRATGKVVHSIQTNATLIDDDFCQMFKHYEFRVGISIDGPITINSERIDWAGKSSFYRTMEGVAKLQQYNIPFTAIAVVTEQNLGKANEIYDFFVRLGCSVLSINIEEVEGVNLRSGVRGGEKVLAFWQDLFDAWRKNPRIEIRELSMVLSWARAIQNNITSEDSEIYNLLPTVAWNGEVYVLSPEFTGMKSAVYNNFVVGNVLRQPLQDILVSAIQAPYVVDFVEGLTSCSNSCDYFSFCRGGQASNKYFEHGTTNCTETEFCRNSKKSVIEAFMSF
jgi:uncharacterized protein